MSLTNPVNWRQMMIDEKLWDYSLKCVPVPPVRQMVEEIEQLRSQLTASAEHVEELRSALSDAIGDLHEEGVSKEYTRPYTEIMNKRIPK